MEGIIVKQSVGVDVSKGDFIACLCSQNDVGSLSYGKPVQFVNNKTGINQFIKWLRKYCRPDLSIRITMEATGVYHESLAVHLSKLKFNVAVVLPNKVKYYAKSLNIKTKTDGVDARVIAQMGLERDLPSWMPPKPIYQKLRSLTRYLQELKDQKLMIGNYLEALTHSAFCDEFVVKSQKMLLRSVEKQLKECEAQIMKVMKSDAEVFERVKNLETIPGIGFATIAVVIAETHGFALFTSRKQLASYAGLDVVERQSGVSVKGKTTISKKGNKRIRNALYFPAIVAVRYNDALKEDYQRIIAHKSHKKIGITAVQRKLLLLMFSLWIKNEVFRPTKPEIMGNVSSPALIDNTKKQVADFKPPAQDKHLINKECLPSSKTKV